MHKDLEDLKRILNNTSSRKSSFCDTEFVLEKICAKTNEQSRSEKVSDFNNNKSQMIKDFSRFLKPVVTVCKTAQCDKCIVSKWCNTYRTQQQRVERNRKALVYADFFCGAGGLSWGFHRAGYKMSLANDLQKCCVKTISFNHPEVPEKHIIAGDINAVLDKIGDLSRFLCVDVVVGGPPCQGFSMANRQRIIDDPRNHLYKSYISAINILKPKFFVMENVRGMLGVKEQIIHDFEKIGYHSSAHILNAKKFGIPQNRERIIFIGNRIGIDNEDVFARIYAYGEEMTDYKLKDAISDLPILKAKNEPNKTEIEDEDTGYTFKRMLLTKGNKYVRLINENRIQKILFNHKARYNNKRDIEIFGRLNPGDNSGDPKIADIMPYKRRGKIFKDKYFKLEPDKPCKTITAHMKFDCNMYIHPSQSRGLTPREAARIQSFPDDYFFTGSFTKTYMQVGNSVPPLLGEFIARAIKETIALEV